MFRTFINRIAWMGVGAVLGVAGMSDVANTLASGAPEFITNVVWEPGSAAWNNFFN